VAKIGASFAQLCTILLIEDLTWFLVRGMSGLESNSLNQHGENILNNIGKLMQPSDWTSSHLGYVDTGLGFVIPFWYLIGIPLVVGIWIIVWRFGK
jgi:hypothetical protein